MTFTVKLNRGVTFTVKLKSGVTFTVKLNRGVTFTVKLNRGVTFTIKYTDCTEKFLRFSFEEVIGKSLKDFCIRACNL